MKAKLLTLSSIAKGDEYIKKLLAAFHPPQEVALAYATGWEEGRDEIIDKMINPPIQIVKFSPKQGERIDELEKLGQDLYHRLFDLAFYNKDDLEGQEWARKARKRLNIRSEEEENES